MSSRVPFGTQRWDASRWTPATSSSTRWTSREAELRNVQKINIAACGTSWHAALAGKFMIERLARIPVEVDYASEFRYRDPITSSKDNHAADFAIRRNRGHDCGAARSQSQRLKDAGHLQRGRLDDYARSRRHRLHACRAGDRRGFDQGFHGQLTALFLLALYLGQLRGAMSTEDAKRSIDELTAAFRANWKRS